MKLVYDGRYEICKHEDISRKKIDLVLDIRSSTKSDTSITIIIPSFITKRQCVIGPFGIFNEVTMNMSSTGKHDGYLFNGI